MHIDNHTGLCSLGFAHVTDLSIIHRHLGAVFFALLWYAASIAASFKVASPGCLPPVTMIVWEPGIFLVCSQMSLLLACFKVSLSFCRLLRPTRIRNPSLDTNSKGAKAPAAFFYPAPPSGSLLPAVPGGSRSARFRSEPGLGSRIPNRHTEAPAPPARSALPIPAERFWPCGTPL